MKCESVASVRSMNDANKRSTRHMNDSYVKHGRHMRLMSKQSVRGRRLANGGITRRGSGLCTRRCAGER